VYYLIEKVIPIMPRALGDVTIGQGWMAKDACDEGNGCNVRGLALALVAAMTTSPSSSHFERVKSLNAQILPTHVLFPVSFLKV
jgi:hypothetical protein